MKIKLSLLAMLLCVFSIAQTNSLIIRDGIQLPKDTVVANLLIKSLNDFLSQKEKPNKDNTYVLKEDLLETSILLDEFKGIEKSGKYKDDNFYKGYLTNVVQLDKDNYSIQLSYIGVNENTPILAASFEILGKQREGKFYFLSPLKRNTALWKSKKMGDYVFHFKNTLNEKTVNEFAKSVSFLDKKLNNPSPKIEWYGCTDFSELLQIIGVKYKINYNGRTLGNFTAVENNTLLMVAANNASFNSYDPHDLFHDRTSLVIPANKVNRNMVCSYAYTYGGSWGISWVDISKKFKEKMIGSGNEDWLNLYLNSYNFGESQEKHLIVTHYVNGLIMEKIEKEKGFSAVEELFTMPSFRTDKANFFKSFEKITGINEINFNEKVGVLIKESGLND